MEPSKKRQRVGNGSLGWETLCGDLRDCSESALQGIKAKYRDAKPFSHIQLNDIFDTDLLNSVKRELLEEEWRPMHNDLYKFEQTKKDLASIDTPAINKLRRLMFEGNVRKAVQTITGITLTNEVDMSGQKYSCGGFLHCHDDDLAGRRVAYVIYLVDESWSSTSGGGLDLYECDSQCQPKKVAKTIIPAFNSLMLFEVTPGSFHRVAEVLEPQGNRLTVSGWFHGDPLPRPPPAIDLSNIPDIRPPRVSASGSRVDLRKWINPAYLDSGAITGINAKLHKDSFVYLWDFLLPEKYEALLGEVYCALGESCWRQVGPDNRRRYSRLRSKGYRDTVKRLNRLLHSRDFTEWLTNVTQLNVSTPIVGEVRRFSPGDYTLEADNRWAASMDCLDMQLYCLCPESMGAIAPVEGNTVLGGERRSVSPTNSLVPSEASSVKSPLVSTTAPTTDTSAPDAQPTDKSTDGSDHGSSSSSSSGSQPWMGGRRGEQLQRFSEDCGGLTTYVNDDEELLSVTPVPNALSLVFSDEGCHRFVRYMEQYKPHPFAPVVDFCYVYRENREGTP
eukprot:Rmarinus@m.18581